jgi:hypothetical protein
LVLWLQRLCLIKFFFITESIVDSDVVIKSKLKKIFDNILSKSLFERIIYFVIFLLVYTLLLFNGLNHYIEFLMTGYGFMENIVDGSNVIENTFYLAIEIVTKLFPFYVLLKLFGNQNNNTNHPNTQDKPTTE